MPPSRQAGQNIRELALKRRVKAIISFVLAGLVVSVPFFWIKLLNPLLKPLSAPSSSQPQFSLDLLPLLSVLCWVAALSLVAEGVYLLKRAKHADQGARGEEDMVQEMLPLKQKGWQVEYGLRLGGGLGDADIVCISPQNKAYVIDVKSHRGNVTTDGKQLYRRMGKTTYPFEKNFLDQAMRQAFQVRKQKRLSFVTPIVAFANAKVSIPSGKLKEVYVVDKSRLVSLLTSLG
jgi:Nuclease-related domain